MLGVAALVPLKMSAQAVAEPDASVGAALENLASRAAIVFAGQVTSIQRQGGVVAIVFRVDTPVVGQAGPVYTLREWAGLWPPGQWRYTVGERAMVFLHGSSQAGFSSAVDGGEGVVPLVRGTDGTPLLNVRRLSTRVLRQVGQPLPDADSGAITLSDAVRLVQSWRTVRGREPSRRPLPPGVGVAPRLVPPVAGEPEARIAVRPGQRAAVSVVIERGADAAQ
jgi:hypothetical protein